MNKRKQPKGGAIEMDGFTPSYYKWCVQRIQEAAEGGFREILWVSDEYAMVVLEYAAALPGISVCDFLAGMLRRRWSLNYPQSIPWKEEGEGINIDWEDFQRHMRLAREPARGALIDSQIWKSRQGDAVKVLKELRQVGKQFDWRLNSESRTSSSVTIEGTKGMRIRTVFMANSLGFTYFHAIRFEGDRVPAMRESFLSRFGFAGDTCFSNFMLYNPNEVASFVAKNTAGFCSWIFDSFCESQDV